MGVHLTGLAYIVVGTPAESAILPETSLPAPYPIEGKGTR